MLKKSNRNLRPDEYAIANLVRPSTRVLDIGCGDGSLLIHLTREKNVVGRGIELSQEGVNFCVSKGLSVIQGNADTDLNFYPKKSFDYVILSQTLQATHDPKNVLLNLNRIGKRSIVSLPNFGHFKIRLKLLTTGQMPKTNLLNEPWFSTPNIHLCTILDFVNLCKDLDLHLESVIVLNEKGKVSFFSKNLYLANLFGQQVLFVIKN
ncbi:MAG: methionine biosynthesis protein MetW [Rhodospirillaceae bacterium]|nr:methionine biosynthesis protein MetW [Rhodospirillaceae bacterium]